MHSNQIGVRRERAVASITVRESRVRVAVSKRAVARSHWRRGPGGEHKYEQRSERRQEISRAPDPQSHRVGEFVISETVRR